MLKGKQMKAWGETVGEITASACLDDADLMAANNAAARIMERNRQVVMNELNLEEDDIVDLPVVVKPIGLTVWPNPVNCLVLGNSLIMPKPFGPELDGRDYFQQVYRELFAEANVDVQCHRQLGEILP